MNSLYDPAFEEMGLPIDPHLRLFLASMNQDKGKFLFNSFVYIVISIYNRYDRISNHILSFIFIVAATSSETNRSK